jgi:hypothetical protein
MKTKLTLSYIIGSMLVMQWHSIGFWRIYINYTGIPLSILIECAMLFNWFYRNSSTQNCILRYLAIIILTIGPLYEISAKPVDNYFEKISLQTDINTVKRDIEELNSSLYQYNKNSNDRLGWREDIRDLHLQKKNKTAIRDSKTEAYNKLPPFEELIIVPLIHMFGLILIMATQIKAITSLRDIKKTRKTKHLKKDVITNKDTYEEKIKILIPLVSKLLEEKFSGNRTQFAAHYGITRPADITLLLNHDFSGKSGKQKISKNAAELIEQLITE